MHIIIYIYMAYEPLPNWDTPSSHPQFVDYPTWQMEHHVFQNEFFEFQISTPNIKAKYHPMMEYQPCFKPTVSDDLYFSHGRLLHGRGPRSSHETIRDSPFIHLFEKMIHDHSQLIWVWWLSLPLWKI